MHLFAVVPSQYNQLGWTDVSSCVVVLKTSFLISILFVARSDHSPERI